MYKTRVMQVKSPCLINKPATLLTFSLPASRCGLGKLEFLVIRSKENKALQDVHVNLE